MDRLPRFRATAVAPAIARAVREWPGWFAAAAGATLLVLGWYGVSGESVVEQQVPYLASATVPGAALIVAGAVLGAGRSTGRGERADRRIEQLYALLVEDEGTADAPGTTSVAPAAAESIGSTASFAPTAADPIESNASSARPPAESTADAELPLAIPEATLYHRRGCPLVAGKSSAEPVDSAAVRQRSLTPCPVCEPAPPATPEAD